MANRLPYPKHKAVVEMVSDRKLFADLDGKTLEEVAAYAVEKLGYPVTPRNVVRARNDAKECGDTVYRMRSGGDSSPMIARLDDLQRRVEELEARLAPQWEAES